MTTAIWIIAGVYLLIYIAVRIIGGNSKTPHNSRTRVIIQPPRKCRNLFKDIEASEQAARNQRKESITRRYYTDNRP